MQKVNDPLPRATKLPNFLILMITVASVQQDYGGPVQGFTLRAQG
jgi:hypothetical protein